MISTFLNNLRTQLMTSSTLGQETTRDGQTLFNSFFQNTVVDNTPAFVLANDFSRFLNFGDVLTQNAVAAVQANGEDVDIFNFRNGVIDANNGPDALASGVQVNGEASVRNFGEIAGEFNGVQFAGPDSTGGLDNFRGGVISSNSRAVDIQGNDIDLRNFGDIVGTGDQRNGTVYTNSTAEDVTISNFSGATIDAGDGNQGAGISLQVGDEVGDEVETDIFNALGATIQGRGQAASNTTLAGDGIRIDNGAEGTILETEIVNAGLISSESTQGTAAGIRIADGASAEGEILNTATGVIEGAANGLYIGEGTHDLDVLNFGTIQSASRAVSIDGTGVNLVNGGDILGTDNQRNGTVYADGTADGIGNVGNSGTTDGIIENTGDILSEGANGTVAGLRVVNGVDFQGEIINTGLIQGEQNGVYFGTGDHTGGVLVNEGEGVIASGSRALNIDGTGLEIENSGVIAGLGDQRNGTVYADSTAQDFEFNNLESGLVDVGLGNNGAGFVAELSAEGNNFTINNDGTILGDSVEGAGSTLAGDGIRFERERVDGVLDGTTTGLFTGDINIGETGAVASLGGGGTTAGIRFVNGVSFSGTINNDGLIDGVTNGLYFGNATPAGGGDFTGAIVNNNGVISSGSRALNIDGTGLTVNNFGDILGTGDQRNGTVYADATADNYTFENFGTVDAGLGNNGSAVALQTGDVAGDNEGLIAGSEDSDVAAGVRVDGGLNLLGAILNEGEIRGTVNAIDASEAASVTIVNDDDGLISGNVLLSDGDDIFVDLGTTNGDIFGGAGDDVIIGGEADDVISGGLGNDVIEGGDGNDTADFSDLDVAVTVDLGANGNGIATRDTGFTVSVANQAIVTPGQFGSAIANGAQFVEARQRLRQRGHRHRLADHQF